MKTKPIIGSLLLLIGLFLSQFTIAAPPSKPAIVVHNEGAVVTVRWYAENADGYRLLYAPYPEKAPKESIEMGTRTEYSLRLPENSAYFVTVQAYNQDGDSPYSDEEYFILDEFALMDKADVNPDALPLRFDYVEVDGAIAFLPTAEDAEEQSQRLRTARRATEPAERASQLGSTVFQEDGKIGLRVDIAKGVVERDLLLSFCLEIEGYCQTLLVWDDSTVNYEETLFVPSVKTDVEKSLYADLLMPPEVIADLRNLVKTPQEFSLRITAVNSVNPQNVAVHAISVPIVDVGGRQTRRKKGEGKIKFVGKDFGGDKFGAKFEIGMELYTYAGIEKTGETNVGNTGTDGEVERKTEQKNQFVAGITFGPEMSLDAKLFEIDWKLLAAGIKVTQNLSSKEQEKRLSYSLELSLLGIDLAGVGDVIEKLSKIYNNFRLLLPPESRDTWDNTFTKLKTYPIGMYCLPDKIKKREKQPDGTVKVEVVKNEQKKYAIKSDLPEGEDDFCSEVPDSLGEREDNLTKEKEDENNSSDINLGDNLSFGTAIGTEQTLLIWVVPLKLSVGISGFLGIKGTMGLTTKPIVVKLKAGPFARLGAYASAAVSVFVASGGVEAELTIIEEMIEADMRVLIDTKPKIAGGINNVLTGPHGKIGAYIKYYWFKKAVPPWEEKTSRLVFVDWKTFKRTDNLLTWADYKPGKWPDWTSVSTSIKGKGGGKVGGTVTAPGGDKIMTLNTDIPPKDAEGWVCFYTITFKELKSDSKPAFCYKANKTQPEIGLPFPDAFDGKIKLVAVWKNAGVILWSGKDFTGYHPDGYSKLMVGGGLVGPIRYYEPSTKVKGYIYDSTQFHMSSAKVVYTPLSSAINWGNGNAYFFKGSHYNKYYIKEVKVAENYPKLIKGHWGFPSSWHNSIDAAFAWNKEQAFFFKGSEYLRFDINKDKVDDGYPTPIKGDWEGLPWSEDIDAVVNWGNGKAYFFKGSEYARYDLKREKTDDGYPKSIKGNWKSLYWSEDIDAAVNWGNDKVYFFKGHEYIAYSIENDAALTAAPMRIDSGDFPGLLSWWE